MLCCQKIFDANIHTVEMFDNSHIQGTFNVSGLVVLRMEFLIRIRIVIINWMATEVMSIV